jgi:hypothetical protein
MISIEFTKLLHSITYYLSYQNRIGRDFMVSESSLKYPVADYLTGLEMPLSRIELEFPHPHLKKRQIDLVTHPVPPSGIETDASKQKIESAYEFKMASAFTKYESEQKRIFNDILRLHLLAKRDACSSYFIMVGAQEDFIQFFRSIPSKKPKANIINASIPSPVGFYTEWFDFEKNGVRDFTVQGADQEIYKHIYNSFLDDYKPKEDTEKLQLPDKLTTKCIAISGLSIDYPTPYVGGIWEIK